MFGPLCFALLAVLQAQLHILRQKFTVSHDIIELMLIAVFMSANTGSL